MIRRNSRRASTGWSRAAWRENSAPAELKRGLGALSGLGKPLILRSHNVFAVGPFEPANDEMPSRHVLEMFDEHVVDGSTAKRTDDGKGLRCDFLRHRHSKPGRHLRDEAHKDRAAFLDEAALGDEARRFGHAPREHSSRREIAALGRVDGIGPSTSAKTCTHASVDSGSERSSPSPRAMSAMDLSMITVETGSSTGSAAKPNAPPAAPDAVAKVLCSRVDPA